MRAAASLVQYPVSAGRAQTDAGRTMDSVTQVLEIRCRPPAGSRGGVRLLAHRHPDVVWVSVFPSPGVTHLKLVSPTLLQPAVRGSAPPRSPSSSPAASG